MRTILVGFGILACLATTGCYQAEQQRAQAHEDHLKRHLGVAGQDGDAGTYARRAAGADVGHAPSAH